MFFSKNNWFSQEQRKCASVSFQFNYLFFENNFYSLVALRCRLFKVVTRHEEWWILSFHQKLEWVIERSHILHFTFFSLLSFKLLFNLISSFNTLFFYFLDFCFSCLVFFQFITIFLFLVSTSISFLTLTTLGTISLIFLFFLFSSFYFLSGFLS